MGTATRGDRGPGDTCQTGLLTAETTLCQLRALHGRREVTSGSCTPCSADPWTPLHAAGGRTSTDAPHTPLASLTAPAKTSGVLLI